MKKSLLLGVVLCFATSMTYAQMGFGVKGGYNLTNVVSDSAEFDNTVRKSGFNFGIFLQFPIKDKISIQTDILFSSGGATTSVTADKVDWQTDPKTLNTTYYATIREQNIVLNYIAIPIMARYAFGPVTLQAGPQIGLLGRALVDDQYTVYRYYNEFGSLKFTQTKVSETEKRKDIQDFYKKADFGFAAGLGGEWGRFQITARYYTGLLNIANNGGKVHNTCISGSIGWRLSNDY